jgi:hypothetical protein
MYKPATYDAMVFTESGANGVHYYAIDSVGNLFCIDSPTACIQEAINYVLSKPTGGKVYIRAGDYYLAPLNTQNCGYAYICATIPYNATLIVEGDGDATRIHLPQNNTSNHAWLFSWGWNGTAPYTRKSKLRNIAFINDVNMGSYAMNVLVTSSSTNNSSGLEVDSISVYDIQGTAFDYTFWINNLYDVTFSRYRFFSINSNTPNTAVLFDSVTLGKIVDSFMFTKNGGNSAISNGTGSILVDSVEIYGTWQYAFNFSSTDGASEINVSNSIIGVGRYGAQGIQGYTVDGPYNLINNSGNGVVNFAMTNSQVFFTQIGYNTNNASNNAIIEIRNNMINVGGCPGYTIAINNPGSGQVYMDIEGNLVAMEYGSGACGDRLINLNGANAIFKFRNNIVFHNATSGPWMSGVGPNTIAEIEDNYIYETGSYNGYAIPSQLIWFGNSSSGGLLKFINNTVTWTATPSNATTFYLAYNPNSSGTYYMPNIIMKGNKFNFPTSNASFGGFVGSAGATTANPNALFVDLDNTFNLSGINLPYPSVSTPSVPSSGTAQQNTYPYPVEVYISGGSATAVQITRGGVTYTVWSSSTATAIPPLLVRLEPGDSITITYSTAPSWTWVPAKYIS